MSSPPKFGSIWFDGLGYRSKAIFRITSPPVNTNIHQYAQYWAIPDNRSARCAASLYGNKLRRTINKVTSRQCLSRLTTCADIAVHGNGCHGSRMRRRKSRYTPVVISWYQLNREVRAALLSIPSGGCVRCGTLCKLPVEGSKEEKGRGVSKFNEKSWFSCNSTGGLQ